jgi:hypothetical protein
VSTRYPTFSGGNDHEGDAGTCPTCGLIDCHGRLQWYDCDGGRNKDIREAVMELPKTIVTAEGEWGQTLVPVADVLALLDGRQLSIARPNFGEQLAAKGGRMSREHEWAVLQGGGWPSATPPPDDWDRPWYWHVRKALRR